MCGINGIIYKKGKPQIHEIQNMNNAIRHRGPDDDGIYKFQNTLLGHLRLSILDLSKKGKQPMSNDGQLWITYNGEIYNFQEIKSQLTQKGYKFYSKTDTEVILNAYKEWGTDSFHKFNGMWSFAILDNKKKQLIISRDRYGVKPCYYYNDNSKFIFSSEIKGIFASESNINFDSKKILIQQKSLDGNFTTFFKNVDIVPPGYFFEINIHSFEIKKVRWWNSLQNLPDISVNYKTNKERLKELLIDATNLRLVSDVKIATSLSGGVDSSIIFSILNNFKYKEKKIDLNPFIMNYDGNKTYDEALQLSNYFKKKPVIVKHTNNNLNDIAEKLSNIEIIDLFFNQIEIYKYQNKKGFKVSIDGHGADESLGGYLKDIEFFGMHFQNGISDLYKTVEGVWGIEKLKQSVEKFKFVKGLNKYDFQIKDFKAITLNNEYIETKVNNFTNKYFLEDIKELESFNLPLQIMYYFSTYGHLQWLLNKWDKASMSNSVEIRSPFLDWKFFQFALALPPEVKIAGGQNKSILREAFKGMMPNNILQKKLKQGLPQIKLENNDKFYNLINEVILNKNFTENNKWNGKKIALDFNNNETKLKKINKIWYVARLYLLYTGFLQRKKDSAIANKKIYENFNKLN